MGVRFIVGRRIGPFWFGVSGRGHRALAWFGWILIIAVVLWAMG